MSYTEWTIEGYGADLSNISVKDAKSLKKLISLAPKYRKRTEKIFEDYEDGDDVEDLVLDLSDKSEYCGCGLAGIIANVMREKEDVYMIACTSFTDGQYLLFGTLYPWDPYLKEGGRERNMTKEEADALMDQYIGIVSDDKVTYDYESVANGG